MSAFASAGTATDRSYSRSTRTWLPIGVILVIRPMSTPSTRTLLPSYRPTAPAKYAVRWLRPASLSVHQIPPATTSASTIAMVKPLVRVWPKRVPLISCNTPVR